MTSQRRVYKIAAHARLRCAAKIVYGSWQEAETAALVLTEDLRDGKLKRQKHGPVTAYQCAVCGCWHIGHCRPPSNPWNHWHAALALLSRQQAGAEV